MDVLITRDDPIRAVHLYLDGLHERTRVLAAEPILADHGGKYNLHT